MDKTTIILSTILALIISLGVPVTQDQFRPDEYVCESRLDLGSYPCDSLSSYYSLDNGKCINKETGNKLCRTGWKRFLDESEVKDIGNDYAKSNAKQWKCDQLKCVPYNFE